MGLFEKHFTCYSSLEDPSGQSWKDACLNAHNVSRQLHKDTPPLEWSDDLALEAQKYADELASTMKIEQSQGSARLGKGENIAWTNSKYQSYMDTSL